MPKRLPRQLAATLALTLSACLENTTAPPIDAVAFGLPPAWFGSDGRGNYQIGLTNTSRTGTGFFLRSSAGSSEFATLGQPIRAEAYRGQRVRWSAWAKQTEVAGESAGLWLRVDGPTGAHVLDNMDDRKLEGSADWHEVSIVVDVPDDAIGVIIGVLLHGGGLLQFDDGKFEVVSKDVPVTALTGVAGSDSTYAKRLAPTYENAVDVPRNLGFEMREPAPSATTDWLKQHSVTLTTTDPAASLDDIAPLTAMIGSAPVVGLGEGTHGTREFFQMKHRIVQHLVTKMGFTHFTIEATSLEADELNRYVQGAGGNPKSLLSRLYFWNLRSQEVLDVIEWLRAYNSTVPTASRVQFSGFDIQYVAAPMDSVTAFIQRLDPGSAAYISSRFGCIAPFRNTLAIPGKPWAAYLTLSADARAACATGLGEVYSLLDSKRAAFAAAEPARFEGALHAARLVQQFEAMLAAGSNSLSSNYARDKAMAENVQWQRQQAGPGAKIIVWAHNDHVNNVANWMGGHLRKAYGSEYVSLGMLFGDGAFNAVNAGDVRANSVIGHPSGVLERYFVGAERPIMLFDARQVSAGGDLALPLSGPIRMRSIGSSYEASSSGLYYHTVRLPTDFDILLFINTTTATTLLPYTP
jgi:erythromycin esterase